MPLVFKSSQMVSIEVIKASKRVAVTTKYNNWEFVFDDMGALDQFIAALQDLKKVDAPPKKEPKMPNFYNQPKRD